MMTDGHVLVVDDVQNWIEAPGSSPKKSIRGVWLTKGVTR